jgi:lipopolysaccharide/colanic/teichoic acid biosynthesis glycosyltransferase
MSGAGLLLFSPVILFIALCIWIEDPGPVLFIKNSVGRGGNNFRQLKFRTMIREAEKATGPMLSSETDARVLRIGRFLRKTALDELPQLFNILLGEMSFVGPRPQRTILVHEYLQHIPGYARRHAVAPGLAGLAQVVGSYFMPPEEKLVWDLRYIQKANLAYDVRLVALALLVVFWLRWQKGWDEKIPDRWLD